MTETITIPEFKALNRKPLESQERKAFRHIMRQHVGVVEEFQFCKSRRFRADYAIPDKMILIEFEGIIAGKSRHTTITGYSRDCIKYNLAAILGFRVLRYTALNFREVWSDLELLSSNGKGSNLNDPPQKRTRVSKRK